MNRLELELIVGKNALDESGALQDPSGLGLSGAVVTIKNMKRDDGTDQTGRASHWVVRTDIQAEPLINWLFCDACDRMGADPYEPAIRYERARILGLADCEPVMIEDVRLSKALAYSVEYTILRVQSAVDAAMRQITDMEESRKSLEESTSPSTSASV